jgi:hypothetical protein
VVGWDFHRWAYLMMTWLDDDVEGCDCSKMLNDVDRLHVKRNKLVGMNFLVI